VQLEQRVVVRRVGEREAAPPAVLEQDVDVLPGEVLQAVAGGSLSRTTATSGAAISIDSTRQGSLRMGMSPARRTSRTSTTRSVFGLATQRRARPAAFSSSVSVEAWCAP